MWPINEKRLADQCSSIHGVSIAGVSHLIGPESTVGASRTVVPHYEELVGRQFMKLGTTAARDFLIHFTPFLRITEKFSQAVIPIGLVKSVI